MNTNEKLKQAFIEEAQDLLAELEGYLLDLETDPNNKEKLDAVFRVMHTIKGSAGMVGFETINHFTHTIEDTFDDIRKGIAVFTSDYANMALEARDVIQFLLENDDKPDQEVRQHMNLILLKLGEDVEMEEDDGLDIAESESDEETEKTYCFRFEPDEDIFLRGIRPLQLLDQLHHLGMLTLVCDLSRIPPLSDLDPEKCLTSWEVFISTDQGKASIEEIFRFIETPEKLNLQLLEDAEFEEGEVKKIGQILEEKGLISADDLQEALKSQRRLGEVLIEDQKVSKNQLESALREQEHLKKINEKKSHAQTGSIRVSTERLDKFVNLVGELVTLSAQLEQVAKNMGDMEVESLSENLQRLMEDLRDSALGVRMIPIGDSFSSFRRLVRDLSRDLDKQIRLETYGNETELDKTVIDRLHDPLMHIIRNSIDHGIESPPERLDHGKDTAGTIKLSAKHVGGNVVITIEDDGRGLSLEKIKKKAVEQGRLTGDEDLNAQELYKMILFSGFSTADKVSTISGRGVGMDVVKKEIDSLGGHIAISSEEGKYTKINLTLPLTMAIIDGLLIKIDEDYYIVPLAAVESCLDMEEAQVDHVKGEGDIIYYRDHFLPYIRLRQFLKYHSEKPKREQLVVIQTEDSLYGLVVDEVIGDHQTVIKNLGKVFKEARGFSGATILGNGQVALILNIATLGKLYKETKGVAV